MIHPDKINKSHKYPLFQKYVENPFTIFCQQVARRLPLQFAIQPIDNSLVQKDKTYIEELKHYELCLRANFTSNKLLFIEITQDGINTGINSELYQKIIQKISQKKPQELISLLTQKPANFIHEKPYTADIIDNQILFWTLFHIGHSGFCTEKVSLIVRKAYHAMQGKQEGEAKGKSETTRLFALKLLRIGMSLEQIAEITELPLQQIQALQKEIQGS